MSNSIATQIADNALGNYQDAQLNAAAKKLDHASKGDQVRYAAREFEAVFISQMLQHMWSSVEVDEVFGGGQAEEIWRETLLQEYGKEISKRGGLGISDAVERQLLKLQEVSDESGR